MTEDSTRPHFKLGEFAATAISGNDILSSCLYVSGIAAIFAGVYAPLVLLLVAGVLFLYRAVYREVVGALPINGGAYNGLLNATSKTFASVAGVMTILSYTATAVISAKVAVEYFHFTLPVVPVVQTTIGLLFLFAVLVILGVRDSARIAQLIFIVHILSLLVFVMVGLWFMVTNRSVFGENILLTIELVGKYRHIAVVLFLAFSASLLGISGFESSANFVEEQRQGVFPKTLRNMWLGVTVFNPLIALVVVSVLPLTQIAAAKDFVLAESAFQIGGSLFGQIIVIDAFLVLSGAVLTSYVGVAGLINRMALDGCLPGLLLQENRRGSHPRIVLTFFLLTSSIFILTRGELLSLAGVYTISFLGVMSLFALGNLVLRETRTQLKRPYRAPLIYVILAFLATTAGIAGNVIIDPRNVFYFGIYFFPALLVVWAMINQGGILRLLLRLTRPLPLLNKFIKRTAEDVLAGRFVVFVHHKRRLFGALEYLNRNETGRNITLVHCKDWEEDSRGRDKSYRRIEHLLPDLREAGVYPHFNIKVIYKDKPFGPAVVDEVARELNIHKNRILIGSIHHHHDFDYHELGGVRIIFD